jgi:fumarate reductase flavoprotein subunit
MHAPPSRTGDALVADLRQAVEKLPSAELVIDAAVVNLVADKDNAVLGLVVEHGSSVERVRAKKVILACNGFAGNPEMVVRYCPEMVDALYFGGEGNTGEGILWGMELGAEVAFMDAFQAHASIATPYGVLITYALIMEGGFQVNSEGKRFGNESSGYSEHALDVLAQPGGYAWDIYDRRLHMLGLNFDDYRQAIDLGAIKKGETIEQLAGELQLPPRVLAETNDAYQRFARDEQVDPFGRPDCQVLEAPYFGVKVTGALFHTQGGLSVDQHGRVLGNGLITALGYGILSGRHAAQAINIDING